LLKKLMIAQEESGHELILNEEIEEIKILWDKDRDNTNYREDCKDNLKNRIIQTKKICADV
ncbi:hypothetical protein, partial [Marinagarivorans algicola]|uniref:hypothetical protein n=1 Tax=Marinagarivorans algicola TaxID=1513270 RepID=UPI001EE40992